MLKIHLRSAEVFQMFMFHDYITWSNYVTLWVGTTQVRSYRSQTWLSVDLDLSVTLAAV